IGLVGLEAVQRQLVFLGKDRDGLEAELVGGAKHANGDLAAIGDEDFLDGHRSGSEQKGRKAMMARLSKSTERTVARPTVRISSSVPAEIAGQMAQIISRRCGLGEDILGRHLAGPAQRPERGRARARPAKAEYRPGAPLKRGPGAVHEVG